ncbi:hypothetical protein BC833DRAFT_638153 [Globomyces pollinis-pini]|nr:hypothetical protein BC833DRAFT_638153 [Globomyces pollinis-pini]
MKMINSEEYAPLFKAKYYLHLVIFFLKIQKGFFAASGSGNSWGGNSFGSMLMWNAVITLTCMVQLLHIMLSFVKRRLIVLESRFDLVHFCQKWDFLNYYLLQSLKNCLKFNVMNIMDIELENDGTKDMKSHFFTKALPCQGSNIDYH